MKKNEPHDGRVLADASNGLQRPSNGGLDHSHSSSTLAGTRQGFSDWLFAAVPWAWCADVPVCALFAIWNVPN